MAITAQKMIDIETFRCILFSFLRLSGTFQHPPSELEYDRMMVVYFDPAVYFHILSFLSNPYILQYKILI